MIEESVLQEDTIVNRYVFNIIFSKYLHDIKFHDKLLKLTIIFEDVYHFPFFPIQEYQIIIIIINRAIKYENKMIKQLE